MSPTGWPMTVTAILLAVAAPIGTYSVVEPRSAGRVPSAPSHGCR